MTLPFAQREKSVYLVSLFPTKAQRIETAYAYAIAVCSRTTC